MREKNLIFLLHFPEDTRENFYWNCEDRALLDSVYPWGLPSFVFYSEPALSLNNTMWLGFSLALIDLRSGGCCVDSQSGFWKHLWKRAHSIPVMNLTRNVPEPACHLSDFSDAHISGAPCILPHLETSAHLAVFRFL